jgi:hypothetical protein
VGLQKVRWDRGGDERAEEYTIFYGKGNEGHELCTGFFFVYNRIITALNRAEFVSERISYTELRVRWCHISVLNVHASTEDVNDTKKI